VRQIDDAVKLSGGHSHTCALTEAGIVRCWGVSTDGALGHGGTLPASNPTQPYLTQAATDIALGNFHSCALLEDTTAACWGSNEHRQLAVTTIQPIALSPQLTSEPSGIAEIAGGLNHTCARFPDGTLSCWGNNDDGQLGRGDKERTPEIVAVTAPL
jgi:alpha-tubulin suppressor-like RCC1 family protein